MSFFLPQTYVWFLLFHDTLRSLCEDKDEVDKLHKFYWWLTDSQKNICRSHFLSHVNEKITLGIWCIVYEHIYPWDLSNIYLSKLTFPMVCLSLQLSTWKNKFIVQRKTSNLPKIFLLVSLPVVGEAEMTEETLFPLLMFVPGTRGVLWAAPEAAVTDHHQLLGRLHLDQGRSL